MAYPVRPNAEWTHLTWIPDSPGCCSCSAFSDSRSLILQGSNLNLWLLHCYIQTGTHSILRLDTATKTNIFSTCPETFSSHTKPLIHKITTLDFFFKQISLISNSHLFWRFINSWKISAGVLLGLYCCAQGVWTPLNIQGLLSQPVQFYPTFQNHASLQRDLETTDVHPDQVRGLIDRLVDQYWLIDCRLNEWLNDNWCRC